MRCLLDRFDSPLGPLLLAWDEGGLRHLVLPTQRWQPAGMTGWQGNTGPAHPAQAIILALLDGSTTGHSLPLAPTGTAFQLRVWQALQQIPHGQTRSYADIAAAIGQPAAVRAVGAAIGRNPLPVLVPCHRVVGRNGELTGFSGGLAAKRQLLALEGIALDRGHDRLA